VKLHRNLPVFFKLQAISYETNTNIALKVTRQGQSLQNIISFRAHRTKLQQFLIGSLSVVCWADTTKHSWQADNNVKYWSPTCS